MLVTKTHKRSRFRSFSSLCGVSEFIHSHTIMDTPIPIAIIGAGLFAKDTICPALRTLGDQFEVKAILSRSRESGEKLAKDFEPKHVDVYIGDQLQELLARTDIVAVSVIVPIDKTVDIVEQCLRAGKHVISEKPASFDVASGLHLLGVQSQLESPRVWAVGENWRFEPAMIEASRLVQEFGRIITSEFISLSPMDATNKYYHTEWRKNPQFKGGYMLDGGVHFVSALRMVTNQSVVRLSASARSTTDTLPTPDTCNVVAWLSDNSASTITISFAGSQRVFIFRVLCENGYVEIERGQENHVHGYWLGVKPSSCKHMARVFYPFAGVPRELTAFATAIRGGKPFETFGKGILPNPAAIPSLTTEPIEDPPQHLLRTGEAEIDPSGLSPVEAVRDVAVVEAILESADLNGAVVTVKTV